ncbi:thiamine-phosphate kinase [Candidatus Bathyarchaeota archaeon]|nr:thiamine-phosphate kinase [Candidatus Bathyarchaeota archaeon]
MKTAKDLGERRIIELILSNVERYPKMYAPFGDDVAAIPIDRGRLAVLKTDMLVGSLDIPPGMSLFQVGRKAVVMNISDFASKGVKPTALLVSLGLPGSCTEENVDDLSKGLNAGCREYGAYLVGGDTSEATDLIIACMVYGTVQAKSFIFRGCSKTGDILAVTGLFGKSAAGLKLINEDLAAPRHLRDKLVESVYVPKAHLKEGLALARSGVATGSIDSSDGLAVSLHEMRKMSGKGFEISMLPVAEEARAFAELNDLDVNDFVLYGGEEYELIVTVRAGDWNRAVEVVARSGGVLIRMGVVTAGPHIILREDGKTTEIPRRGWEHFKMQ